MKKAPSQLSVYKIAWLILGLGMTLIVVTLLMYWLTHQDEKGGKIKRSESLGEQESMESKNENEFDPEVIDGLIENYYSKDQNADSDSWGILKKQIDDEGTESYNETAERADVLVNGVKKITSGSLYLFHPEFSDDIPNTLEAGVETIGFIKNKETEKVEKLTVYFDPYKMPYLELDTDEIETGNYDLCIWIKDQDISCQKIEKVQSPLIYKKPYDKLQLDYYISPEGYYVKFGNIKYYYPGLGVEKYRYEDNENYIVVEPSINEWKEGKIINAKTGKILPISIQFESIWKKIPEGYRIYTCEDSIFSDGKIGYVDLDTSSNEMTEVEIAQEPDVCRMKDGMIQVIEADGENHYNYFEYSISDDKKINRIEDITSTEDYIMPGDEEFQRFLDKYVNKSE